MSVRMAGGLPIISQAEFDAAWARRSYLSYCEYVHHGAWIPGSHHRLICEVLDKVVRGELKRVMFWLPPQHGKSMAITETFPSYYLGKNPRKRVIEASYNDDFARKFGRRNREKIIEFGSRLWNIGLSQINFGASRWDLDNDIGGMLSVGIGGAATGEGADLLIVDDPIKDSAEASEMSQREVDKTLTKALQKQFPPEFVNRIDNIVTFAPLSRETIGQIVRVEVGNLRQRLKTQGHQLSVTPEVIGELVEKSYDRKNGARPVKRAVQTYLEDPLTDILLRKPKQKKITIKNIKQHAL